MLKKVCDTLLAAKPYWVAMEYGTIQKMGSGDFAASSDWNGSAFRQRLAKPKIHFGYNFMLDPENSGFHPTNLTLSSPRSALIRSRKTRSAKLAGFEEA